MLSFWAECELSEVESYVRGLMLPPFMSHLAMEPIDLTGQPHNRDGRGCLTIHYSGPGRWEEFQLRPEEHFFDLLRTFDEKIDPAKIVFASNDPLWNWEPDNDFPNRQVLKLFFRPKKALFGKVDSAPFASDEAYVSVSRREIFLSQQVVNRYLTVRCLDLLRPDSPLLADDFPLEPQMRFHAGIYHFRLGALGGSLVPEDRELTGDMALFAGLAPSLEYVADFIALPPNTGPVRFDGDGIRISLVERE